ncbi:MAG: hypothetical protein QM800_12765 [Paludibacter sp.]
MDNQVTTATIAPVVIISIKLVQQAFYPTISESKAKRMIALFKDANPKPKHHIYTMQEFYKYFGIL